MCWSVPPGWRSVVPRYRRGCAASGFTRLWPSKTRTPPLSLVFTDWPSMINTDEHSLRPGKLSGLLVDRSMETGPDVRVLPNSEANDAVPGGGNSLGEDRWCVGVHQCV